MQLGSGRLLIHEKPDTYCVRYHIFPIPTSIDLATRRLRVTGLVDKPLALSKVAIEKYFLATRRRGFV